MHFQYVVAPSTFALPMPSPTPMPEGQGSLLRELIDVQREQLAFMRAAHESQNASNRWQAFFARHSEEFPGIGDGCRRSCAKTD